MGLPSQGLVVHELLLHACIPKRSPQARISLRLWDAAMRGDEGRPGGRARRELEVLVPDKTSEPLSYAR